MWSNWLTGGFYCPPIGWPLASVLGSFLISAAKFIGGGSTFIFGFKASYFFRCLLAIPTWLFSLSRASMRPLDSNINKTMIQMNLIFTYLKITGILWVPFPIPRKSWWLTSSLVVAQGQTYPSCISSTALRCTLDEVLIKWKRNIILSTDGLWGIRQGSILSFLPWWCTSHIG